MAKSFLEYRNASWYDSGSSSFDPFSPSKGDYITSDWSLDLKNPFMPTTMKYESMDVDLGMTMASQLTGSTEAVGGSWAVNWKPNFINAAVTGVLTALGNMFGSYTPAAVYRYYERQEAEYLRNAEEQARRVQLKGDIALRNLEIKHKLARGKNELAAAAQGGHLSGSNLDMLVENHRYNDMDEMTSSLETLWEVDNVKRSGYINAMNTAAQAAQVAYKSRGNALSGIVKGIQAASASLLADKRYVNSQMSRDRILDKMNDYEWNKLTSFYGGVDALTNRPSSLYIDSNLNTISKAALGTVSDTTSGVDITPELQINTSLLDLDINQGTSSLQIRE